MNGGSAMEFNEKRRTLVSYNRADGIFRWLDQRTVEMKKEHTGYALVERTQKGMLFFQDAGRKKTLIYNSLDKLPKGNYN